MKLVRKTSARPTHAGRDHESRLQEVLRAKKTLDAYFKGLRTDREARGALKIIKAFVRDRERQDPQRRPPLAVSGPAATRAPAQRHPRRRRTSDPAAAGRHGVDDVLDGVNAAVSVAPDIADVADK